MWSLQLCAGLEAGIEGETHDVAQRLRERTAVALEERAEEASGDGSIEVEGCEGSTGGKVAVVGVGEVPSPPLRSQATGGRKGEKATSLKP